MLLRANERCEHRMGETSIRLPWAVVGCRLNYSVLIELGPTQLILECVDVSSACGVSTRSKLIVNLMLVVENEC